MSDLGPLAPTLTAARFAPLGRDLVGLLRGLAPDDWARPTVCSKWAVKDIAAHLLDSACRRVSIERDGHAPPPPRRPIEDYSGLVAYLDELNADWVRAARRLSPALLTDLLDAVERDLAEVILGLDPQAPARFPVSWAGDAGSTTWFDIARELTERWLHQQQIRLAVGAQALTEPELSRAVFDTFLRALPRGYAGVDAGPGETVGIEIVGVEVYEYALCRGSGGWALLAGRAAEPAAEIRVPEQVAWLSLTKGLPTDAALERARVDGREPLVRAFFETVAVMA